MVAAASLRRWHADFAPVVRATLHSFRAACLSLCYGCGPTGCSSTWQRRTFCGVRRLVGSMRSRMNQWGWAWTSLFRSVRNLDIHLDSDLSMNTHITRTVSCCFDVLRQIRSISRTVSQPVVQSLSVWRQDYGSATLAGLPACQLDGLQIGHRAFSVAASRAWNSLPLSVTSLASLQVFQKHLKTVLFICSFPSQRHFSTFYIVNLFYSSVLRVFLSCVLVYSGFMYRGLAVLWLYGTLIVFVFTLHYITLPGTAANRHLKL